MSEIDKTLNERGSRYGSFESNAAVTQKCLDIMLQGESADLLCAIHKEAIHMILHKLSRIVNGDPDYADSWIDISGYATLVAKEVDR